jgi:hypothetical protein
MLVTEQQVEFRELLFRGYADVKQELLTLTLDT